MLESAFSINGGWTNNTDCIQNPQNPVDMVGGFSTRTLLLLDMIVGGARCS
jgi:hypothetical protein